MINKEFQIVTCKHYNYKEEECGFLEDKSYFDCSQVLCDCPSKVDWVYYLINKNNLVIVEENK